MHVCVQAHVCDGDGGGGDDGDGDGYDEVVMVGVG